MTHVCPVHCEPFKRDSVPVKYGLIRYSDEYIAAKYAGFPWSASSVNGGCVVSPDSPKDRYVEYCQQCRANEAMWHEEHPSSTFKFE